jgi:hypothetical protein
MASRMTGSWVALEDQDIFIDGTLLSVYQHNAIS